MSKHPIPADIKPEHLVAQIDSREQCPLDLDPLAVEVVTLQTGDYSLRGMNHLVAIERKELNDLIACCGAERDRFEKEIQRLMGYPCRCIVVEGSWRQIEAGQYRSEIKPASVIGSLLSWMVQGIPILMADDHERAGRYVARMLLLAARRRWRENRALLARLDEPEKEETT